MLKVLELFAGTRSIGKAFEARGHQVFSVDWDPSFENIDLCADVKDLTAERVVFEMDGRPDVIWASPDCSTYSVAALRTHREKGTFYPKTGYAEFCDGLNIRLHKLIRELAPPSGSSRIRAGRCAKWPSWRACPATPSHIASTGING